MTPIVFYIVLGCLGLVAILGVLTPASIRSSLSRFLVADDLARAVEKAQSSGKIQNISVDPDGRLEISVLDGEQSHLVTVYRSPDFIVSARFNPDDLFPNPARYAWDHNCCQLPEDTRFDLDEVQRMLKATFEEVLLEKEFVHTKDGTADFLLRFQIVNDGVVQASEYLLIEDMIESSLDLNDNNELAKLIRESSIERACLILDLLDFQNGAVVWRGVAQADLEFKIVDEERYQRRRDAIAAILQQYPPKQNRNV